MLERFSPWGPSSLLVLPTNILLLRYVPVVKIKASHSISVLSANIIPLIVLFSTIKFSTIPSIMVKFSSEFRAFNISLGYVILSPWARSDLTAGPLALLSILIWIWVLSAILPINPPKASISRTTIPLAVPPIDGLHGISAIFFIFAVTNAVFRPILAEALAASHPAWPPPTTITSYFIFIPYFPKQNFENNSSNKSSLYVAPIISPNVS